VDEAIRRANLYLEAGADMAYVEGLKSLDEIIKVGREVRGLLYYSATEYRPWTNISRKDIKNIRI
jgi:2-methylisocitrate lyase-like PEP mutase family enzyme